MHVFMLTVGSHNINLLRQNSVFVEIDAVQPCRVLVRLLYCKAFKHATSAEHRK